MQRLPILIAALTTASSAFATPAEDMAAMIRSWIGHTAEDLVRVWGEAEQKPSRIRTTFYHYYGEGGRPGIRAAGVQAVQGGRTGCSVTFEVDRRGLVADATWSTEGASDRERARRTCWRAFRKNQPPD